MRVLTAATTTDIAKPQDTSGTTALDGRDTAPGGTSVLRAAIPSTTGTRSATPPTAAGTIAAGGNQ